MNDAHEGVTVVTPRVYEPHPQGTCRRRLRRGVQYRPTRQDRLTFDAIKSAVQVTPDDFVNTAMQFLHWNYSQQGDRCGGSGHSFDCSGLMCHVMRLLGLVPPDYCVTSFVLANLCWADGLIIPSFAQARATKAVFAFIGRNGGRLPYPGDEGHIVCGRGDGTTIEAMGRAYGVVVGTFDNRGYYRGSQWDACSYIPGVNYGPPPPGPFTEQEQDMILQPRAGVPAGRKCVVGVSVDGTYIVEFNGANIKGDERHQSDPSNLRRWYPKAEDGKTLFLGVNQHYIGLAAHLDGGGVTATRNDGATVDGTWGSL